MAPDRARRAALREDIGDPGTNLRATRQIYRRRRLDEMDPPRATQSEPAEPIIVHMPAQRFVERSHLAPEIGRHDPARRGRKIVDPDAALVGVDLKLIRRDEIASLKTSKRPGEKIRLPLIIVFEQGDEIVILRRCGICSGVDGGGLTAPVATREGYIQTRTKRGRN